MTIKPPAIVIPAKAGTQPQQKTLCFGLGPGLRRGDGEVE